MILETNNGNSCGCAVNATTNGTLNNYNGVNTANVNQLNQLNQSNQIMTTQNSYANGWRGCTPPAPIVLKQTVGVGITNLFMPDFTGLFAAYGGTVGGQAFDVDGPATPQNLLNWLATGFLYVSSFSLQSTLESTLQNNLSLITSQMDGSNLPQVISSSANVSNQQYNPLLLNVCCGFILTNTTALRIPVTNEGEVVKLTLTIGACGNYGQLPDFLATNPIITCAGTNCLR